MRRAPDPEYRYEVEELVRLYKQAVADILDELERLDISALSRAQSRAALAEVARILSELNEESAAWVERNIPAAARDGVKAVLFELGVAATMAEAEKIASFNRINEEAVAAAVADMQSDLLAVSQNIDRKVRAAVRQVTSEVMRENMTKGISGRKTLSREMLDRLRRRLGNAAYTGIIDAAGRRWRPDVYVDMLARTKLMDVYLEAKINEALSRDAYYGIISTTATKDACRFHIGRIIKLTPEAPGPYITLDELRASNQIFHPRCVHTFSTFRSPDRLPEAVREKAEKQAELGDKALATGKKNPKEAEVRNEHYKQ